MHKSCEELKGMKVSELLEIAKLLNIQCRHSMRKQILIDSIIQSQGVTRSLDDELAEEVESQWHQDDAKGDTKATYVENAKIGMLIAFKVNDRKALSGMIEEIHQAGFVVKTKNGVRFNVRKKNVMWVKTGDRWPRGVYLALKGETACANYKAVN